jgi:hypothetical protein
MYNVSWIPSTIVLDETGAAYLSGSGVPNSAASWQYLQSVFGRSLGGGVGATGGPAGTGGFLLTGGVVRWSTGSTAATPPVSYVTLQGDQCLVFFLGGVGGATGAPQGFSTNPTDPSNFAGVGRKGPFAEFDSSRLFLRQALAGIQSAASVYPSYQDRYRHRDLTTQIPYGFYAYFSSGRTQNGYNNVSSDCSGLNVSPYYQSQIGPTRQYYKPNGHQIISPGANGRFGPGGLWNASNFYSMGSDGTDDLANFAEAPLGTAP